MDKMRYGKRGMTDCQCSQQDERSIMTLTGKRVVVLGGSSGIGLATAQAAAGEGA
jgi:trans-2-enoyl-CoA reductase